LFTFLCNQFVRQKTEGLAPGGRRQHVGLSDAGLGGRYDVQTTNAPPSGVVAGRQRVRQVVRGPTRRPFAVNSTQKSSEILDLSDADGDYANVTHQICVRACVRQTPLRCWRQLLLLLAHCQRRENVGTANTPEVCRRNNSEIREY